MKKTIFNFILVLLVLALAIIACEKDPASSERDLTPEEKEILRIQDSLKNLLNADTFFIFKVDLPQDDVDYSWVDVQLDSTRLAKSLGFTTAAELKAALGTRVGNVQDGHTVTWMAINKSTGFDYTGDYTAYDFGFWWDKNGDVCSWDDTEGASSSYYTQANYNNWITQVGQFPGRLAVDETVTLVNLLVNAAGYRVALVMDVTVGEEPEYEDPETAPTGDPTDVDTTITLSRTYVTDWSATEIDVRKTMRNAFKMTTYQIYQAINEGDLVYEGYNSDGSVYVDGDGNVASTANYPGHWYSVDGDVTVWGDTISAPVVWSEIASEEASLLLQFGNHPDNASAGTTITFKQKAILNGGSVTFNISLTLE